MSERGRFIVLEGGDATGKSTQVLLLARRLREMGREVETTFEPGRTHVGATIRGLVLEEPLDPRAEALLIAADRAQHVAEVVRPALERGVDVVSDRFVPSSLAYQGVARGLGVEEVWRLSDWATATLEPDLVIVLDTHEEVVRTRRAGPAGDRLEREGSAFHDQVVRAYRELAESHGWVLVDALGEIDAVAERVWNAVAEAFDG
ncbi:MAG TPA: dTMP kinase [Acidimicrobiia bacterium]|nr:dTMP kinase [Acidimicrobiia bacterium]